MKSPKDRLKELELEKLKLFGKALRQYPSSPRQKETHAKIEKIHAEILRLSRDAEEK